jgi:hypothetical protein
MAGLLHVIAAAAVLGILSPASAAPAPVRVDLELVIAVDVSGSMDAGEFALQREGYVAAIRHPDFVAAILSGAYRRIALTYVEWSGSDRQTVTVPWRLIDGPEAAEAFAGALAARPLVIDRGTSISAALLFGAGLFHTNAFDGERRVIDISGDGPNNYGPTVTVARDIAVAEGVVINGLPILIRPSPLYPAMDRYYADCVIGGAGSFLLPITSEEEFAEAIRHKLVIEVAAQPPDANAPVVHVGGHEPADCLIGERMRSKYADPFLPGL